MRLSVVPSWTMITCSGLRPSIDGLRVFDHHFCSICCQFCHSEPVLERFCDAGCSKMAIWSKYLWHLQGDFDHFIMKKCHILTIRRGELPHWRHGLTDGQTESPLLSPPFVGPPAVRLCRLWCKLVFKELNYQLKPVRPFYVTVNN